MKKLLIILCCVVFLLLQAVVQINLASNDSQTTDEAVHLSAGYTYLTRHDFRFNPEHPPIVKMLAAVPLLALHPTISAAAELDWRNSSNFFYDSWRENRHFGELFLYNSGNNPDLLLFWARLPMVALTLLLGVTILLIAYRQWGAQAALLATGLYAFNPLINGHGHLITTDIGLSLGYLLTIYSFWRLMQKPQWGSAIVFGLAFGLALLSKHTAVISFFSLMLLFAVSLLQQPQALKGKKLYVKLLLSLLVTIGVIWAGFGFHDRTLPASLSVTHEASGANVENSTSGYSNPAFDQAYKVGRSLLFFLPADYLKGVFLVVGHTRSGQGSFLLGQSSYTGWWYYFPLLFLLKTPLPELIVIGIALYFFIRTKPKESLPTFLLIGAASFLAIAMLSKANLGLRHVMPIYPLLFLLVAWGVSKARVFYLISLIALAWTIIIFCLSYPVYLGYFNELAGGSANGYQIATDSNLDWGQDLKRIATYIDDHQLKNVYIEYNWLGNSALDYYLGKGNYHQLSSWQPGQEGYAIIGASAIQQPQYQYLINCPGQQRINNDVFICKLH